MKGAFTMNQQQEFALHTLVRLKIVELHLKGATKEQLEKATDTSTSYKDLVHFLVKSN